MDEKYVVCPSIVDVLKRLEEQESKIERMERTLEKVDSKVRNMTTVPVSINDKEDLEKPVRSIVEDVIAEMKHSGEL